MPKTSTRKSGRSSANSTSVCPSWRRSRVTSRRGCTSTALRALRARALDSRSDIAEDAADRLAQRAEREHRADRNDAQDQDVLDKCLPIIRRKLAYQMTHLKLH